MKTIKVLEHGTAYAYVDDEFVCYPLLKDNRIDKEGYSVVIESPVSFREKHIEVLKELGVSKERIEEVLNSIGYYEGNTQW